MDRARWEKFLIVLGVVEYLLMFPHGIHGDAFVRENALRSLLQTGQFAPMVYSYVHPLFSALLLPFGYLYKDGLWWLSRFNCIFFLGTAFYFFRELRARYGWEPGEARAALLLLLGATMFPKHVTDYYAEVFSACMILLAILQFQRGRSVLAILAVCLATWNAIATIVGGGALLVFFALRSRRWRYLAVLPLLPIGFAIENFLKYGEAYPTAYITMAMQAGPYTMVPYARGPGFSYPLFFGLLNVLLSFGRGLLFFTPGLVLFFYSPFWKKKNKENELLFFSGVYLAGLLLVYSKYWAWHAGAFWGPRYLLFASIPAAFALAVFLRERAAPRPWRIVWCVCVLLSCWVACQGVLYGTDFLQDCFMRGHEQEFLCQYLPQYSVLWRYFSVLPPLQGRRVAYLAYFLLVAGTLLWRPALGLGKEAVAGIGSLWREYGLGTGWRA